MQRSRSACRARRRRQVPPTTDNSTVPTPQYPGSASGIGRRAPAEGAHAGTDGRHLPPPVARIPSRPAGNPRGCAPMSEPRIEIRPARHDEIAVVTRLAHATWHAHYPGIITVEQIDYMLARGYAAGALEGFLGRRDRGCELAVVDGEPAGFAAWYVTDDPGEAKLDKLYVLQARQRSGLGGRLLRHVAGLARAVGATTLSSASTSATSRRSTRTKSTDRDPRGGRQRHRDGIRDGRLPDGAQVVSASAATARRADHERRERRARSRSRSREIETQRRKPREAQSTSFTTVCVVVLRSPVSSPADTMVDGKGG